MSAPAPKSPLAPHNSVVPTPPKLAAEPAPKPAAAPAAADLDAAPQDAPLEVSEDSADATLLAPAAEPAPPAAPARLRFTQYAPGVEGHAEEAGAAAYDASMEASADSGLSWYERHIAANIARNKARFAALGLGGGLTGGASVVPRAAQRRRARDPYEVDRDFTEADAAAAMGSDDEEDVAPRRSPRLAVPAVKEHDEAAAAARALDRAARDDDAAAERDAERERQRQEKLAAREAKREAKLAAAAERAAAKVEADNQKDAKLAAVAADCALAEINDTALDMSRLSVRQSTVFRAHFLAHAIEHRPGRKAHGRDEYVIKVDVRAKIKCPRRPVTG
jgi:hypothetical protein